MHPTIIAAYDRAMPQIDAQERLASIGVIAAGTGSMAEDDRKQLLAALRRDAGARGGVSRPASTDELRKATAGMGIGLVIVEREG